ncbi:MAG: type II secretion system F family protein [Bacteriovoracia bacterium]
MPEYQYQGVDKAGKRISGRLEAPTEGELRMMLRGQGIRPMRISKSGMLNADLGSIIRGGQLASVPLPQLALFTRQLQVLVGSGIPLVQSLEVLGDQASNPSLKKILAAVRSKVSQGSFLWESLASYQTSFPRVYLALIRAGETSGAMEQMLDRLAKYLETSAKINKMVKGAMMYPFFVVIVAVGVIAAMLTFVIPKFETLLSQNGQELPGPTKFVIDVSHAINNNIVVIIGAAIMASYMMARYIKTEEGRAFLHRLIFRMPMFGEIATKAGVARFSRTMGTLLSSGVNLIDAIDICRVTVDNVVLEEAMATLRKEIETGKTMGMVLNRIKVFPKMATQMVSVGEATGNMEQMLDKVADMYEQDVETLVGGISKLIEPIILVVLGGIVAGLMVAMYLPIFKIAGGGE